MVARHERRGHGTPRRRAALSGPGGPRRRARSGEARGARPGIHGDLAGQAARAISCSSIHRRDLTLPRESERAPLRRQEARRAGAVARAHAPPEPWTWPLTRLPARRQEARRRSIAQLPLEVLMRLRQSPAARLRRTVALLGHRGRARHPVDRRTGARARWCSRRARDQWEAGRPMPPPVDRDAARGLRSAGAAGGEEHAGAACSSTPPIAMSDKNEDGRQRRGRAPRHQQERRARDAGRPPRLVARGHGRDRQRRGQRGDARGHAHPRGRSPCRSRARCASSCGAARSRASTARART